MFRLFIFFFKNISFIATFITVFYEAFIKFGYIFFHLKPFTSTSWDIAHPYKLFASKYMRVFMISMMILYFLSKFFIYLLFAIARPWHIYPLIPFSTINNIPIFINNFNFISFFFESFRICLQVIMYLSEHTNNYIHPEFFY